MSKRNQFCPICGQPTNGKVYDRPACKQKAYRQRVKAKKDAQKNTITLEDFIVQDKAIKNYGQNMENLLGTFFARHGKESYTDLLTVLAQVLD